MKELRGKIDALEQEDAKLTEEWECIATEIQQLNQLLGSI